MALAAGVVPSLVAAQTPPVPAARRAPMTSGAPWQDPVADSLVARAIARRGVQLADSTLLSYRATAHGFLAFLAQLGEGTIIPPRVVQSEELALTIAWWQPGQSAQRLVGRRDTTLLPADVAYYRDRYGVVLDNLPDRIRLGDGQDVRDVPHPLAQRARDLYEYQGVGPLRIRIPGREIVVDEVRFRPKNASLPAAIGTVFLDRETAAVVRLSMTFTRAAIIDRRIETLVVTLENGLVRERYWLPRRQEVEVSRGSTWLDIPVRGIVRGRWEIAGYDVNEAIPPETKALPRWSSAPRDSLARHPFEGRVTDVLPPEIQIASSEEVVRARVQAEAAVRAAMLSRPARAQVTGRGVSDLARFTRTEGLAVGAGASHTTGGGLLFAARARYGLGDRQVKGRVSVGRAPAFGREPLLQLFAEREYRDLAPPERAGVTNSLASLAFGSDYTSQVDSRGGGIRLRRSPTDPFTLRLAYTSEFPLDVRAPALGHRYRPAPAAWRTEGGSAELAGTGGWVAADPASSFSGRWSTTTQLGVLRGRDIAGREVRPIALRSHGVLSLDRRLAGDRGAFLETRWGVAAGRDLPPQWLVFAGGPWSAPGYAFHQFATRAYLSQRLELRQPIPAPSIPLGRFGKAPGRVTLAPFVQATAVGAGLARGAPTPGVYPSVGVGTLLFFDLVRADVARGLRDGRWRFSIDIDRAFWGIL
jgi:hypothetical protein